MANFSALKTAIQNAIKQNGNEDITGNVLQQILLSIVSTMGDGAINTIEQNLSSETLARQNADNTLQQNINSEAGARQGADGTLQSHIDAEALARGNADTQLQNAINAIKANIDNGYVYAGIATPSSTPVSGKVFYIATAAGTYTNFGGQVLTQGINILRYNGSAWSSQQIIGIDDEPTAGSNNIVKSGGVQNELALGAVYDVSAKNPTAGPNNDGKWESLSALLSDANLNTLIPTAYRKGGMSIKFVRTYDNNYIQARCMAQNFTTDVAYWQGVDANPVQNSVNLVESGGTYIAIKNVESLINPGLERTQYTVISGGINGAGKIEIPRDNSWITDVIPVLPGQTVEVHRTDGQKFPATATICGVTNADDTQISFSYIPPERDYVNTTVIPNNIYYIRLRVQVTDHNPNYLELYINRGNKIDNLQDEIDDLTEIVNHPSVLYVRTNGNDTNDGSYSKPFATINKAIQSVKKENSLIIVGAGEYRETLDFNNLTVQNITLRSESKEDVVKIMGSDSVALTKTIGYNNIYEATKETFLSQSGMGQVYLMGVPSLPQTLDGDYPQTNGVNYRLPYKCYSNNNVPSSLSDALSYIDEHGGMYYDSANTKVYVSDIEISLSGKSVEVIVRDTTTQLAGNDMKINAVIEGIDFYFSKSNLGAFNSYNFNSLKFLYCKGYGCLGTNFNSNVAMATYVYCESANSCYDGFGSNYYAADYSAIEESKGPKNIYIGCWSHDNFDDGCSHHARGKVTYIGCLSTNNNGDGFGEANGSQIEYIDCISDGNGIGFSCLSSVDDGRLATSTLLHNCIAKNTRTSGFLANGSGTKKAIMTLINCISEANAKGYNSVNSLSKIVCYNCMSLNDTTIKYGDGEIVIKNAVLLE